MHRRKEARFFFTVLHRLLSCGIEVESGDFYAPADSPQGHLLRRTEI
jgi:hypothetical protein